MMHENIQDINMGNMEVETHHKRDGKAISNWWGCDWDGWTMEHPFNSSSDDNFSLAQQIEIY